jgi:AraC-like DNA-binding protein
MKFLLEIAKDFGKIVKMKRITSFPQWKGFEFTPEGCLLDQVIDLDPAMGFAYERSCEFFKSFHTHDRLMLVCPRGSSQMEVRTQKSKETFLVDSSSILLVPKGLVHDDEGVSCIYDTMALYPTDELIETTAKALNIKKAQLNTLREKCIKIRRTKKLLQLTQEYFFEKVINKQGFQNPTLEYLGSKILSEVLSQIFPENGRSFSEEKMSAENSIAVRALQYIESNLFHPIELNQIAKYSGASISTLLRRFKTEIKQTPYAYIKARRLEEALNLMKEGTRSVSEVALLVGYENLGAFTDAFKSKYNKTPSVFLKTHN